MLMRGAARARVLARALPTATTAATSPSPLIVPAALASERGLRALHASAASEWSGPVVAGFTVAGLAITARYTIEAYQKWQANRPKTNIATRMYAGGFEDEMTRAEAAKILGLRESATADKIRERHRKLLILNHPDTGGSTFLATKVNEAKEILLKGAGGQS